MHCSRDWKVFGESISEACGRVIKAGGGTEAILQKWVPRKTRCGQVPYQNLICLAKWRGILRIFKQQPGPLPRTQAPTHIYIHSLAHWASVWLPFLVRNNALARLICKSPPVRPPARSAAGNESNTRLLQMPLSQRRWRERRPRCNLLPAATFFQCGDILHLSCSTSVKRNALFPSDWALNGRARHLVSQRK